MIAIAVIGRNEGERLRAALRSAIEAGVPAVYVDSGSGDGSVALARSEGVAVVELDAAAPFTAGRARNAGFEHLSGGLPALRYVQFLDGDCRLVPGWLDHAAAALDRDPRLAAVAGRIREADPQANVFHRLGALEWQREPGEVMACGGNLMVRAEAFRGVGGFRADVIAAEDDELCLRLRRAGGRIVLLDHDMVVHDLAMTRFGQWWRRAKRAGHAYAQGAALHGDAAERHFVRDCRRIWFWALALPATALGLAWPTGGLSLVLLAAYPLQVVRLYANGRRRGWARRDALAYAAFTVLGKFPSLIGMLTYHLRRRTGRQMRIIEHKGGGIAP
jgi:GT2 family glycosyltransferase